MLNPIKAIAEYNQFLRSLNNYELAYLDYCKEKERRKKHWIN